AAAALQDARERVAGALGMRPADIIFTSGGTEANNLAVKGIVLGALQAAPARRRLMTTPLEHESVLESADHLRRLHGVDTTLLPVDGQGVLDPQDLEAALSDETALVSFAHANNEIGTVQDVAALAAVARARRVPVHVDAVQSAGWL